jgi:hypothetical protein
MRSVILAFALVMLSASLTAQGVFANKTQAILEKVIQDYPNHFYNIKGELIGQALQTARYRSTVQLPGSTSSTVTLVTSAGTQGSDWNCTVLETTDFSVARARFAEIYQQLSNNIISTVEQRTFILSGQYETPAEDKKYTEVMFNLLPGVGEMKRLRVQLTMHEEERGWVVALSVTDKDPREIARF